MLAAVVIAFFVCWAPYHTQRLLFLYVSLYGEWTNTLKKINQDLFSIAGCFYYFNSTINPILYSVMSNRFRVAFREKLCKDKNPIWCCCCCCCECGKDETTSKTQRIAIYRNSHSQSSIKSCFSYPLNNTRLKANNSFPRLRAGMDNGDQSGITWFKNPHYTSVSVRYDTKHGNTEIIQVGPEKNKINDSSIQKNELAEELNSALEPELAKFTESEPECVDCTNCNIFQPKIKSQLYSLVDKSSSSIQNDESTKISDTLAESNV